jgi:hypothetical protein
MLRRDFIQISSLSVAGLLAAGTPGQATPVSKSVAILSPDLQHGSDSSWRDALAGATAMLREREVPYEVIQQGADFSSYPVLVLPDHVQFTNDFRAKIETYLQQGGALLASFQSGLTPDGGQFATPAFGLQLVGNSRFSPDFIDIQASVLGSHIASSELVMYRRGMEVVSHGATLLAHTLAPLPDAGTYPAVTEYGKVIYFMHPIFTQYHRTAPRWCRQLVLNALNRLAPGVANLKILDTGFEISI